MRSLCKLIIITVIVGILSVLLLLAGAKLLKYILDFSCDLIFLRFLFS